MYHWIVVQSVFITNVDIFAWIFCNFQKEQEQLQSKLTATETMSENLLSDNTKLQVYITTLQSQSTSLASQHTALQLANSQLVAEKEEVSMQ